MERLTKNYSDGTHGASDDLPCGENSYDYKNLLIDKLGKYEDLEEQGRLVKLPCKVGDTVYVIVAKKISVQKIQRATIDSEDRIEFCTKRRGFELFDIGKTVFLTKSEAEAKLKELRGGDNDRISKN